MLQHHVSTFLNEGFISRVYCALIQLCADLPVRVFCDDVLSGASPLRAAKTSCPPVDFLLQFSSD